MPSEYWSLLSVYDLQQQKIFDKRIRVNEPLSHHGITFYQSSYGTIPNAKGKIVLNIKLKNAPGPGETVVVDPGASVYVASIDRTIKALGIGPYGGIPPRERSSSTSPGTTSSSILLSSLKCCVARPTLRSFAPR
jgi:hypothetical protein